MSFKNWLQKKKPLPPAVKIEPKTSKKAAATPEELEALWNGKHGLTSAEKAELPTHWLSDAQLKAAWGDGNTEEEKDDGKRWVR